MAKVAITVVKKFDPEDVFGCQVKSQSGDVVPACSAFNVGTRFVVDDITQMPEGFCGWAWRDLYKNVSILYFGGDFLEPYYIGDELIQPTITYTSCSDGIRPVIFKLERIES
jgi:uncharacterized repeat protein (TIGR04076 family)